MKPVLDAVVESAARLWDARDVVIRLADADGDTFRVAAHQGLSPDSSLEEHIPIHRDLATGRAFLERRVVHVSDVLAEPDAELATSKAYAAGDGLTEIRTIVAAPLLRKGMAIGAIGIRRTEVRPFTDKQIELLKTFADQAVIAIENTRLFNELQTKTQELARSVERLRTLSEISQAVNSTLDMGQVLNTIVERAVQLSSADAGLVYELDKMDSFNRAQSTAFRRRLALNSQASH